MKLSACLVIRNEEKYLPKCLESITEVVDEVILVHDGKCEDKSIEIAQRYKAKVYVRPYVGEAEYHRPFSFEKAGGEWILQIDADEFLPDGIKTKIKTLIQTENTDAYSFWWPYFYGKNYIKKGPFSRTFKPCLFRKSKMFMIGISHEYPRTYGRLIKSKDIHLHHRNDYDKYSEKSFKDKWVKWAKIQAKQIHNIDSAPTFNIGELPVNSVYRYYDFMRGHPIISGILETLRYVYIFIKRGILWSGYDNFRIARFELRYLWLVRIYLLNLEHDKRL